MPTVRFTVPSLQTEVRLGTTILEAARGVGAPVGEACGGACACSTCHVYVEQGRELLSELDQNEEDVLDKAFDVRDTSRLGCQARIVRDGLVVVRISEESVEAFLNEHPDAPPDDADEG